MTLFMVLFPLLFLVACLPGCGPDNRPAAPASPPPCAIAGLEEKLAKLEKENRFNVHDRVEPLRLIQDRYHTTFRAKNANTANAVIDETWDLKLQILVEMQQFPELKDKYPARITVGSAYSEINYLRELEVPATRSSSALSRVAPRQDLEARLACSCITMTTLSNT